MYHCLAKNTSRLMTQQYLHWIFNQSTTDDDCQELLTLLPFSALPFFLTYLRSFGLGIGGENWGIWWIWWWESWLGILMDEENGCLESMNPEILKMIFSHQLCIKETSLIQICNCCFYHQFGCLNFRSHVWNIYIPTFGLLLW